MIIGTEFIERIWRGKYSEKMLVGAGALSVPKGLMPQLGSKKFFTSRDNEDDIKGDDENSASENINEDAEDSVEDLFT